MATIPAFAHIDPDHYNSPVFEPANRLFGVETPTRNLILFWGSGLQIHLAVIPVADIAEPVAPADIRAVTIGGVTLSSFDLSPIPSMMVIDGELIMAVNIRYTGDVSRLQVLVADDADDPTDWTIRSTIYETASADLTYYRPSYITKMDSGRWVYSGSWQHFVSGSGFRHLHNCGIWYSDDSGTTWTVGVDEVFFGAGLRFSDIVHFQSSRIELDPVSGRLFFMQRGISSEADDTAVLWTSTNGADWTKTSTFPACPDADLMGGFVNDGDYAYAVFHSGEVRQIHDLDTLTGVTVGDIGDYSILHIDSLVLANGRALHFSSGQIIFALWPAGWIVGSIGFGGPPVDECP